MTSQPGHVVIQTAFLGDLFLAIPVFRQLKKTFPSDKIILICKSGLGDYFLQTQIVDQVIEITKGDANTYSQVISLLAKENIVNLYCIHRSLRSQILSWKIKAERKIGFGSLIGKLIFDDLVKYPKSWPDTLRQLNILASTDQSLASKLNEKDWSYLNSVGKNGSLLAVPIVFQNPPQGKVPASRSLAVFPGSVWNTKRWTMQGFASLVKHFTEIGYQVHLMGGPEEKNLCEDIQKIAGCGLVQAGKLSISESVKFIASCSLVICNDSAPAHMAASLDIPVVSIFGPTTLELGFRPWSSRAVVVQNMFLECRPCGKHGHEVCPLGHHRCMTEIKAEVVIEAGLNLLNSISP